MVQTVGACLRYRVTGLAAEAAFFAILSLPPLIFGLAGAIGFVARRFDVAHDRRASRQQVLALARRVLTEDAVDDVIAPTLDDVLSGGQLRGRSRSASCWRCGRARGRSTSSSTPSRSCTGWPGAAASSDPAAVLLSLRGLPAVSASLLVPLVLAGPGVVDRLLPARLDVLGEPLLAGGAAGLGVLPTSLYHLSVPVRSRWRADLPGAALTLSDLDRRQRPAPPRAQRHTGSTSIYGPLAAPIAVLIWLYLISSPC